jgi:hypothetical protein
MSSQPKFEVSSDPINLHEPQQIAEIKSPDRKKQKSPSKELISNEELLNMIEDQIEAYEPLSR